MKQVLLRPSPNKAKIILLLVFFAKPNSRSFWTKTDKNRTKGRCILGMRYYPEGKNTSSVSTMTSKSLGNGEAFEL